MKIRADDVTGTSRTFSGNGGNFVVTTRGDDAVLIGARRRPLSPICSS
jgi:hypothetical protein